MFEIPNIYQLICHLVSGRMTFVTRWHLHSMSTGNSSASPFSQLTCETWFISDSDVTFGTCLIRCVCRWGWQLSSKQKENVCDWHCDIVTPFEMARSFSIRCEVLQYFCTVVNSEWWETMWCHRLSNTNFTHPMHFEIVVVVVVLFLQ